MHARVRPCSACVDRGQTSRAPADWPSQPTDSVRAAASHPMQAGQPVAGPMHSTLAGSSPVQSRRPARLLTVETTVCRCACFGTHAAACRSARHPGWPNPTHHPTEQHCATLDTPLGMQLGTQESGGANHNSRSVPAIGVHSRPEILSAGPASYHSALPTLVAPADGRQAHVSPECLCGCTQGLGPAGRARLSPE